mmetsp:Transcript_10539/g.28024  ORF Transcript_10539/g.28024 Transcript_10539/m.28024 type:complete len:92 (-) Transcript_10539:782-1057(-)
MVMREVFANVRRALIVAGGFLSYHVGRYFSHNVAEEKRKEYRDAVTREELFTRLQLEVDTRNAQAEAVQSSAPMSEADRFASGPESDYVRE